MTLAARTDASLPASDQPKLRIAIFSGGDQIGDGLFKLPFIRNLRATFPGAEILWLASNASVYTRALKDAVAPFIDRVVERTGLATSLSEVIWPKRLDLGRIDIAIDTQTVLARSIALRRALKPRIFITAAADYRLSDIQPSDIGSKATSKPSHLVDHLMRLLELAARGKLKEDAAALEIPADLIRAATARLPAGKSYVGFAPGAGDTTKRWPLERFIALAGKVARLGYVPVFFFGPDERDMLEEVRGALPEAIFPEENLPDDVPRGPLLVSAFGHRLSAAVANDSGTGHMLAVSEVPLILLFGRHSPAKYAPRTPHLHTVWAESFGGPAHDLIPYEAVETELLKALDGTGEGARERLAPQDSSC